MIDSPCLILAGGFGTRLRSVISEVPKPLAPVGDKPFLHWLLRKLEYQGVKEITVSLHHQASLIEQYLESESFGLKISTVIEPEPMGTGGAIAYAVNQQQWHGSFFTINGDTWLGAWAASLSRVNAPAIGLVQVEDASRYGRVDWQDQKVRRFIEKKPHAGPGWINAGVYLLQASDFHNWDGQPFSLERDLLPEWAQQERLQACPLKTEFIDIGVPEDYHRFCEWHQSKKLT